MTDQWLNEMLDMINIYLRSTFQPFYDKEHPMVELSSLLGSESVHGSKCVALKIFRFSEKSSFKEP
jgi:hypothetical protein